jgi:predicted Zn-dependent protease
VVGHEIGHCAGLRHVEDTEDLMYASTQPFASYSDEAISKFISSLFSSIGKL